jgi:hypothetical protein
MSTGNKVFRHLTTSFTGALSVNSGAILGSVIINTPPTGTGGTLAIYDDQAATAANQIAAINLINPNVPGFDYNIAASRGLWIVYVQGGTIVGDITITFQ